MEINQKFELRKLLLPQLRQSLNILALPHLELKSLIDQELESNPTLEEKEKKDSPKTNPDLPPTIFRKDDSDFDFRINQITKKITLQEALLRQLGMFTNNDIDYQIGVELIGNIDENGYLKTTIEEAAQALKTSAQNVEKVLDLIQQFEPAGVGARSVSECLLIQLKLANENDPLLVKIASCHLEDIAKKNYCMIAKTLNEPLEKIEPLIKKLLKLDPKPGRNYSLDEIQQVYPDIILELKDDDEIAITINNEDIPDLNISQTYREMVKNNNLDPKTKEFLTEKLRQANELLRAISKRQTTLRRIVETVVEIQQEAIRENLSELKPLNFAQVGEKIEMHESTVCRAVMGKYVKTPFGVVALKDFFPSHIHGQNGESVSSNAVKGRIKEMIEQEDKKRPLSDQDIASLLKENALNVSRRTVAKYREELKILSSPFRRER